MATIHQSPRRPRADRLIIFFTGWGMDEQQTGHLAADDDCDVWTVSDYSDPVRLPAIPGCYRSCTLVAWSLGVWAAAEAAPSLPPLDAAIAVNGTLHPVDEANGIAPHIFNGTIDNWLDPRARRRFLLRMTGSPEAAAAFLPPRRDPSSQQRELQAIARRSIAAAPGCNPFTCALVGGNDRIFPPAAQRHAWGLQPATRVVDFPAPHAPFAAFTRWSDFLRLADNA